MPPPPRFRFNEGGTRFRIYPQPARLGFAPLTVHVDAPPGSIGPGPRDATIETIDAVAKLGYRADGTEAIRRRPPYAGRRRPGVEPAGGHFDHVQPGTREFGVTAPFAAVRLVIEIWRHYLERPVRWHFADTVSPRLELFPLIRSWNAWSGEGYIELGSPYYPDDRDDPYRENFEVVAHETGHLILKSVIGTMPDDEKSMQHRAHEEAAADFIAMLSTLHFPPVVARALAQSHGQLYGNNVLSRMGEWDVTKATSIRHLFNEATLDAARRDPKLNKHRLSLVFSGALFDLFAEILKDRLVERQALSRALARRARHRPGVPVADVKAAFALAHRRVPGAFHEALLDTRDELARLLARAWRSMPRPSVTFAAAATQLLAADAERAGTARGPRATLIRDVFGARGIATAP
ncbi:MAG: hypothetical protein WED01_00750 [Candidatus Rokuibacteriota bacterium]